MDISSLTPSELLELEVRSRGLADFIKQVREKHERPKRIKKGGLTPEQRQKVKNDYQKAKLRRATRNKTF